MINASRGVLVAVVTGALLAGSVAVAFGDDGPHTEKVGALAGSTETVTYADGHTETGSAPASYTPARGASGDIWLAYGPGAVAIDTVEQLAPGRLEAHRTRDPATGATHTTLTQQLDASGTVLHVIVDCSGGPIGSEAEFAARCTQDAWSTPAAGASSARARKAAKHVKVKRVRYHR
ncbi:MAG TPA: hypothetical protein VGM33_23860 [Baekduia sp.]|jgi:hypothetical protein